MQQENNASLTNSFISSDLNTLSKKKAFVYDDLPKLIKHMHGYQLLNIIPLQAMSKEPAIKLWKPYQNKIYPPIRLKRHIGNFGVICGDPTGCKNGYLTVIDLDNPELIKYFKDIDTYTVKSARKGYHLFFISERNNEDKKFFEREYGLNIDILGSEKYYSVLAPSYVVYQNSETGVIEHVGNHVQITKLDYKTGEEFFKRVPNAQEFIENILVQNGFKRKTQRTLKNNAGKKLIKEEVQERKSRIISILKEAIPDHGGRQDYAMCVAGTLKQKAKYPEPVTEEIFKEVFDDEIKQRLDAVKYTYQKDGEMLQGWGFLKGYLTGHQQEEFLSLISSNVMDLEDKIISKLAKNKYPTPKELTDYLSHSLELYRNPDTFRNYERLENGSLVEITSKRIEQFFNDEFGVNAISPKLCETALDGISNPIEKDYDLVEFTNGVLNTRTREFKEDKEQLKKVPKISLPFKWNPAAGGGRIKEIVDDILTNPKYPEDHDLWLRAVGHAFLGINRIGKHVIVAGPPRSGKSTLNTMLERIFNVSKVPVVGICKNERFTLYPMIDKDINIDDDINNGVLRNIGYLNSVTTGNALEVEVKGENRRVSASNQQIPRLFSSGNSLPPVVGEGFPERLLLIHAANVRDPEERDEQLQAAIMVGEYDDGLEWLVYTALNRYWKSMDKPIVLNKNMEEMVKVYEMRSNPVRVAIMELFEEDQKNEEDIETRVCHNHIKNWLKAKFKEGLISKDHLKAGQKHMSNEMGKAGYFSERKYLKGTDERVTIYQDVKISEKGRELITDCLKT